MVTLACALPSSADDNVARAIHSYVEALCAGDLAAFEAIADGPVSGNGWRALREFLETSHSIHVDSFEWTLEKQSGPSATVRLELDATRLTRGEIKERTAVPSSWMLELVCASDACRIQSVITRETAVARAIVAAPPDQWEALIESGVDMRTLIRELADEAIWGKPPRETNPAESKQRMLDLIAFIRDLAARDGDLAGESNCVRVYSIWVRSQAEDGVPVAAEAVALAQRSGDADAIAEAFHALGMARWTRADVPRALEDFAAAWSMLDRLRDPRIGLKALAMLAYISTNSGELRDALEYARRLAEGSVRYGWVEGEASAAMYMGGVHYILRAPAVTRRYLEVAQEKAIAARSDRNEIYALNNFALCDSLMGNPEAAIDQYRRAIAQFKPDMDVAARHAILSGLAANLLSVGRQTEADETVQKLLDDPKVRPGSVASALSIRAEIRLAQGRPKDALDAARQAIAVWDSVTLTEGKGTNYDTTAWAMEAIAGRALKRLGRTSEAESALRRSIARIEEQYSQAGLANAAADDYFSDKIDPYAELAEILVARGRAAEALEFSERMRARVLEALLEQGKIDVTATMEPASKERERELSARLAELNRTLLENPKSKEARKARDAARLELDRFRDELFLLRPAVRLRRPLSAGPIAIPPALAGTVFVEYVVRDRRVLAISARRGRDGRTLATATAIPVSKHRLDTLVRSFVEALERRDAGYRERARELYDVLLRPVEAQLRARKRICVIPDGILWKLPFHALVDRDGRHVIERAPLFYAASLRTLALAAEYESRDGLRSLLALGNPELSTQAAEQAVAFQRDADTGPLPDAGREVEAIGALYRRKPAKVLVGAAATEDAFKREAASYRVLHVAAHALFDERAPMYSALLLSSRKDGSEDGFLEAREIADLTLNSDVAVLSACDTARGRFGAGEGLIGMSWALQAAGCPTAIVSQWKVASAPTAQLMIAFHRNLLAGASKAESLRGAALELMRERAYAHPFYWSPFILVGAP